MDYTMSWMEFYENIKAILEKSDELGDKWELIGSKDPEDEGASYLVKKTHQLSRPCLEKFDYIDAQPLEIEDTACVSTQPEIDQTLLFEYHIVYHKSYCVPILCYNAYKSNGALMRIDEAWLTFNIQYQSFGNYTPEYMRSVLTEMDHPILFKPFLTLHPCRTPELLAIFSQSKNKVLTFLSTMGPAINLTLDIRYGQI